jgi:hypothetical protein
MPLVAGSATSVCATPGSGSPLLSCAMGGFLLG